MQYTACLIATLLLHFSSVKAEALLELELVSDGFVRPVFVTHSGDGSGRLFVLEQGGRVRIIQGGAVLPVPFLDISLKITGGGERGLLGLAFHPEFVTNGRFFLNYTKTVEGQLRTVIAEYRVSVGDPNQAAPGETIILEFDQPFANHNGGMLAFGPDGLLYIATGDGGSAGDPRNNAQNLDSLLGKILRIDVDGDQPYSIPDSNPFSGQPDVREEIFAYGFRNPWRFSFDRSTGRLFVGDVGQASWEEIDVVSNGGNYGWRIMEGAHCFNPSTGCDTEALELPIAEYSHAEGSSVTGGYVYRGSGSEEFWGSYFFGDFPTGRIWSLNEGPGGRWEKVFLLDTDLNIASFGESEQGDLFVVDLRGAVYRLGFAWREFFAHAGDGISSVGIFQSNIILVNRTLERMDGSLRFFKSDGSLHLERTFQVPGGRSVAMPTSGLSNPVYVGWAEVVADRAFAGTLIFTLSNLVGQPVREAGVASSGRDSFFRTHVSRHALRGIDTGLAVANPSPFPVTVTIRVMGPAGLLAEVPIDLEPGQHLARFVGELQQIPGQFEGTAEIEGTGEFILTLLRTQAGIHSASLPVSH